jgi:hypothetical protein
MVRNTKQDIRRDLATVLEQMQRKMMDGEFLEVQVSLEEVGSHICLMDVYGNQDAPAREGRMLSGKWIIHKHYGPADVFSTAWHMVGSII